MHLGLPFKCIWKPVYFINETPPPNIVILRCGQQEIIHIFSYCLKNAGVVYIYLPHCKGTVIRVVILSSKD